MARGHQINHVPEIPLVVDRLNKQKTSDLLTILSKLGVMEEVQKCKNSRKIRTGSGKQRNRRYVMRKGPLVVFDSDNLGIVQGARNIPGVECCHVDRLNILQLAPGGHLGRFIIWTQNAFQKLNQLFGSIEDPSLLKKGYIMERPLMNNANLARIINSDEIQSVVRTKRTNPILHDRRKRNPLKNKALMNKLNPFDKERKSTATKFAAECKSKKESLKKAKKEARKKNRLHGRKFIGAYTKGLNAANNATLKEYNDYIKSIKIGKDAMKFNETEK